MIAKSDWIKDNLKRVKDRIDAAARRAGRDAGEVELMTVTKTQSPEVIRAAYDAGARVFGENYPEETVPKMSALYDLPEIQWHMIGHLQSRKAKIVAGSFDMFEALDSLELAQKLDRLCGLIPRRLDVLLEFNVGGESAKSGWDASRTDVWPELGDLVAQIAALPNLRIRGLMTMPPFSDDPRVSRPYFVQLRELRGYLATRLPGVDFAHLSMGTSSDFEIAIEEGATIVRIGTAILGPRAARITD